jgi:hypothetical protein
LRIELAAVLTDGCDFGLEFLLKFGRTFLLRAGRFELLLTLLDGIGQGGRRRRGIGDLRRCGKARRGNAGGQQYERDAGHRERAAVARMIPR